jgi:hypothetical protein
MAAHVRSRFNFSFVFLSLVHILSSLPAMCQSAQISGLVTDPSKAAIPEATVEIVNQNTDVKTSSRSNGSGLYIASSLIPGKYRISVTAPGFDMQVVENLVIEVGARASLDFVLHAGKVTESVTVDGTGLQINTTDATVSTVVDRQFVENIPLNGRSFQSLMTAVPGVVAVPSQGVGYSGELSVNGQRTEANYFTVDGVSANTGASTSNAGDGAGFSGTTPGETVLGTTQSIISIDALQEFRASTSTYSAEYGRSPGGQFSFQSRSGTNTWHGSAYDYLRNNAFDSNAWFNGYQNNPPEAKQAERQNDFGGTFGGPVWLPGLYRGQDKTFFFFSYEGLRLESPTPAQRYVVPSAHLRNSVVPGLQPVLDAFPVPDSSTEDDAGVAYFTSGYSSPSRLNSTSIRGDHSFNDKFKVFGRYGYNPSSGLTRGSDLANLTNSTDNVQTITLGSTNLIGSHSTNEARFNWTENTVGSNSYLDDFGGAKPYGLSAVPGLTDKDWFGFYFFLAQRVEYSFAPTTARQRQINVVDGFSTTLGRHSLKWGIDYRRLVNSQSVPSFYEWSWAFDQDVILANNFDTVALYRYTAPVKPIYTNFSAYGQDEWKVNGRLSLSLGLRWDVNPAPHDANGNDPYTVDQITNLLTTKLAPRGTPLWKTTYGNFAPRLGLAYQLHQHAGHETVFRAGAGLFYDTGNTNASSGYTDIGSVYRYFTSGSFPATQATLDSVPAPNVNPPYNVLVNAFDPNLKLPRTVQWNAAVQQSLGANQTLTLTYIGAAGRRLLLPRSFDVGSLGNPNFLPGAASSLILTLNGASSNYDALQVQFQKRISRGLQALLSYNWSHSNDTSSSNFEVTELLKADSDYDIRNNFQAAVTYEIPDWGVNSWAAAPLRHWAVDTRVTARSALPVDVQSDLSAVEGSGAAVSYHPNRVASQPLYIRDSTFPGSRQINPAAFVVATDTQGNNIEGNAGRNSARAFDAVQADLAIRREFPIHERLNLQFRAEAFNILNHPVFGSIYNTLDAGTDAEGRNAFGQAYTTLNNSLGGLNALYQVGGPRSLQLALKLHF